MGATSRNLNKRDLELNKNNQFTGMPTNLHDHNLGLENAILFFNGDNFPRRKFIEKYHDLGTSTVKKRSGFFSLSTILIKLMLKQCGIRKVLKNEYINKN